MEHHRKWQIHRFALEKVIHLKANEKRVVDGRYLDMPAASFEGLRFAKQMELNTRGFELKFNLIPPGLVYFGRPPGRRGLNPRVHQSKPFWMMETELTADVLKAYRDAHGTPYEGELLIKSEEKDWRRVYAGQELSLIAATHLIKKEAMQIADWLAEDLPAGFKSKGSLEFRVPTTAEYVHAAHGNAETAWYWGDDISGAYEHEAMSLSGGHYVKRADANPFGLYDMYGNAPEVLLDNCFMDPRTWNDAWDFCGRLSEKGGRCNGGSIAIGGVTSEELIGGFGPGLRKVDPHWYIGCRYVLSPHRFVEMRGKE
ncbi:MAG: SUMF1/EgtB/PvdO family nonheme iron enzyme [Planctomycetota bacterium]|nr:SUMF1/EgtB/PvdO family nonheme iron enzyme [Planctomycetota bacterium]